MRENDKDMLTGEPGSADTSPPEETKGAATTAYTEQNTKETPQQEDIQNDSETDKKKRPELSELESELERERYKTRYRSVFRSTVFTLVTVAAIAILVATLWMPVLQIYGTSMTPTLNDGDIVLSYKTSNLKRGDVVAFYYNNRILVKRFIAGPGDWVDMDDQGNVYVNGDLLDEPYVSDKSLGETNIELPYQVPDSRIFVLGDHRTVSIDSRNSSVGCVSNDQIVGELIFRVWPLKGFGLVK